MEHLTCKHHGVYACRACLEYCERSPDTLRRAKDREHALRVMALAPNPMNRIEDREADLLRRLQVR